jgi:two-component system, sensor histidine kinase LadS
VSSAARVSLGPCLRRWVLSLLCVLSLSSSARAELVDVSSSMDGESLGTRVELLEDESGKLGIEDVQHARFVRSRVEVPSFGFTRSVYWLRVNVRNLRTEERAWLLEVGYPLLDHVKLYLPREGGGFDQRETGDMVPFAQRDIAYRNFLFSLHEPPSSERTYYLRVASSGSLTLPLQAWSLREFMEHQHLDWSVQCMFYGVLLIMVLYGLGVWVATRQFEYLPYAGYVFSMAVFQFTLAGHTFQFLLPRDFWLVHALVPVSVISALTFAGFLVSASLSGHELLRHSARRVALVCAACVPVSAFLPYRWVIPFVTVAGFLFLGLVTLFAGRLVRVNDKQGKLFLVGWSSAIIGGMTAALVKAGLLPVVFVTEWSIQIGVTLQLVLLSSGFADKLNTARTELAALHERLSHKLNDLSAALARAEDASEHARQATRQKNEFMATMSHEFRTPLNPIINIPQGMRREFTAVRRAQCAGCQAHFELDEGDRLDADTLCPECGRAGSLTPSTSYRFEGDASRARALISKVEHSGRHLLTVVNGILDFSKMQAGHLTLSRERISLAALCQELKRALGEQAQQRGQRLDFELPDGDLGLDADPARALQVLGCLTDNAIKYSEPGGVITVRAVRSGLGCTFSVRDRGIGIARENFERIFESFEQVHKGNTRRYGGTGLGLSIARSLVRMHGGDVRVQSEVGHGSTFSFELPLAVAEQQAWSA